MTEHSSESKANMTVRLPTNMKTMKTIQIKKGALILHAVSSFVCYVICVCYMSQCYKFIVSTFQIEGFIDLRDTLYTDLHVC